MATQTNFSVGSYQEKDIVASSGTTDLGGGGQGAQDAVTEVGHSVIVASTATSDNVQWSSRLERRND